MSKNELTVNTNQGYMNLANGGINGDFLEELSGLDNEFERIKIPAGGGVMFESPSGNPNEPDMIKEFSAVILYHYPKTVTFKRQKIR